jgi:CheY-like chemotaxis protein
MPIPLIAVIDDDQSVRELFTEVLEDEGYRVVPCASRADAVSCVQRAHPDVVILDLWMETPTGGWEVCQALADNPSTATVPVIICSTSTVEQYPPPTNLQLEPIAFIPKPFQVMELLTAVERALGSKDYCLS